MKDKCFDFEMMMRIDQVVQLILTIQNELKQEVKSANHKDNMRTFVFVPKGEKVNDTQTFVPDLNRSSSSINRFQDSCRFQIDKTRPPASLL